MTASGVSLLCSASNEDCLLWEVNEAFLLAESSMSAARPLPVCTVPAYVFFSGTSCRPHSLEESVTWGPAACVTFDPSGLLVALCRGNNVYIYNAEVIVLG